MMNLNKRIHGECLFSAWHRVGTNNDNAYNYTLCGLEETDQAISSIPQDKQNVYFSSKLTKQLLCFSFHFSGSLGLWEEVP